MGYVEDLRRIVGHRPLILVGAVVMIENRNGEILLQQRKFPKDVWGLPGGLMELGESTEEAAKREVFEETQLQVHDLELMDVYSGADFFVEAQNGDEYFTVTTAYATSSYTGFLRADPEESTQCSFVDPKVLPVNMVGSHRLMIEEYVKKKHQMN
ncbi:NUDIX hydrolase [Halobacillus naozhouensis]|uniref:NUDIX hydrolase n=1 Tax=Halobacillus naozhouensis TaxID=554880 RepID=A0ABY8J4S0_9BACI|nr:NUDIX hydrolase [Halobacillus naozhouensis]WFT75755.1 NUDIX hydrolase [Halobacillus naozhouensis]